jgi:hypothetical protein
MISGGLDSQDLQQFLHNGLGEVFKYSPFGSNLSHTSLRRFFDRLSHQRKGWEGQAIQMPIIPFRKGRLRLQATGVLQGMIEGTMAKNRKMVSGIL